VPTVSDQRVTLPRRTLSTPWETATYSTTPAAIATGASVNRSRHATSWHASLAPQMKRCLNHRPFSGIAVAHVTRSGEDDQRG
jgi:hypothetical protein